ncbi:hypothetical protein GCM10029964_055750 [Kibdelosporangium lantanae]
MLCSLHAANRDPEFVSNPDNVDLSRTQNAHLTFGYGIRRCIGAPLAQVEMSTVYRETFRRFPDLRLAVPFDQVQFQSAMVTYSVTALPVTW